jgi:Uma2 family endonuclease
MASPEESGQEDRMAVTQRMSVQAYEDFVLSGVEGLWELHDGVLVEKPGMSWRHLDIVTELVYLLRSQLDRAKYRVFAEGRVRRAADTVLLPDVMVLPAAYGEPIVDDTGLAIFSGPLLLVVDVWSRSTGDYDLNTKLPVYQERGDREIWRIHPFERTLTRWIWQPDGTYAMSVHHGGVLILAAVPDAEIAIQIDLDWLLAGGISRE